MFLVQCGNLRKALLTKFSILCVRKDIPQEWESLLNAETKVINNHSKDTRNVKFSEKRNNDILSSLYKCGCDVM